MRLINSRTPGALHKRLVPSTLLLERRRHRFLGSTLLCVGRALPRSVTTELGTDPPTNLATTLATDAVMYGSRRTAWPAGRRVGIISLLIATCPRSGNSFLLYYIINVFDLVFRQFADLRSKTIKVPACHQSLTSVGVKLSKPLWSVPAYHHKNRMSWR